jgi:hypothetical protein
VQRPDREMLEQNVAGTVKTRNCTAELKDPHSSTLLENQEELQDDGTQIRDVCCGSARV